MRQFFPVQDLARDERFVQTNMAERLADKRSTILGSTRDQDDDDAPARKSAKIRAQATAAAQAAIGVLKAGLQPAAQP